MGKFFNANFWFNLRPGRLIPVYHNLLVGFIIAMAVLGVVALILKRNKKNLYFRFWERILNFSWTNAFIGLVLWFLNYEMIQVFSARFWYLLWFISMVVWIIFIFKHLRTIPERKKEIAEERAYKKYIP